jgi:hypothetical protein
LTSSASDASSSLSPMRCWFLVVFPFFLNNFDVKQFFIFLVWLAFRPVLVPGERRECHPRPVRPDRPGLLRREPWGSFYPNLHCATNRRTFCSSRQFLPLSLLPWKVYRYSWLSLAKLLGLFKLILSFFCRFVMSFHLNCFWFLLNTNKMTKIPYLQILKRLTFYCCLLLSVSPMINNNVLFTIYIIGWVISSK